MLNESIVSVDLGSAYTKVAVRANWLSEAELVRDSPLASAEVSFCIPTVVAKVERHGEAQWLIGVAAASQRPGDGVTIYHNWKAGLFGLDAALAGRPGPASLSGGWRSSECEAVARQFFASLRTHLRIPGMPELSDCSVRTSVPHLEGGPHPEATMRAILDGAGWQVARGRATVYEPEANVVGVLSRGKNAVWQLPVQDFTKDRGLTANLVKMLDVGMLRQAMGEMRNRYRILLIDVGAFTTDFGFVIFDGSLMTEALNRPTEIVQQSVPLGVRDLDRMIIEHLSTDAQDAVSGATVAEWESAKAKLYSGSSAQLRRPHGGICRLGEGHDLHIVQEVVQKFADQVRSARSQFLQGVADGETDLEMLTGGGAMIPLVHDVLVDNDLKANRHTVYDLLDRDGAEESLKLTLRTVRERDVEDRVRQNLELIRGGTAIGACSVWFED